MRIYLFLAFILAAIMPIAPVFAGKTVVAVEISNEWSLKGNYYSPYGSNRLNAYDSIKQLFTSRLANNPSITLVVSGNEYNAATTWQDRVFGSGRYSEESRKRVNIGNMVAPDELYWLSVVSVNTSYDTRDIGFGNRYDGGVNYRSRKFRVDVSMVLDRIDVSTGVHRPGFEASAKEEKTIAFVADVNIKGNNIRIGDDQKQAESRVINEAISEAIDDLITKITPSQASGQYSTPSNEVELIRSHVPVKPAVADFATGIVELYTPNDEILDLSISGKIYIGSKIVFTRREQKIAYYKVCKIVGNKVYTEKIKGEPCSPIMDDDKFVIQ